MEKEMMERLHNEHARRLHETARKLMDEDDVEGAKKQLDGAETSAKVLASMQLATVRKWSAIIAALCWRSLAI